MSESSSQEPREVRWSSMDRPPSTFAPDPSGLLSEDQFLCSICLDVFTDPVSTPCGHNFCMKCIKTCWGDSEQCHCPFCKEEFTKRPELKVNTAFREVVDHFKKKNALDKPEVLCDACIEVKQKALKSCLNCVVSFCESHLEPHNNVPKLNKHKLINPVKNLEDYICQKHERPLELFCRDDKTCVCLFCTEGDHKDHNIVPIEEENGEKKTQLEKTQSEVQQMIQDRLKKIKDIKHSVELRKRNTEKEKADSVELFTALIRSIERSQAELLEVMEEKQKAAERQAEDLIKELEQEITELKRRDTELEQLSHTEDHLLQIYPLLCRPPHTKNWTDISTDPHLSVETVRNTLSQLQKSLNETLTETITEKIRDSVSTDLKRIQQFAVDVTLDADTAHPKLILSDDRKQVTHGDTEQNLPDNPKRFDRCQCVLGKEGFSSGRFYYEVQVREKTAWTLGVALESIDRKGKIKLKPQNGIWAVALRNENEYKARADPSVLLSLREQLQKVGVFVDYEEGLVSFYDMESRSHIYSFTGQSFTEKLYPYFNPCINDGGKNSAPLIVLPLSKTE
ncbi:zinc finger protein RFP-like [Colossoma macropomum]|uniref:zinc finger protein RFP-like n=1 Tax=Colossoma macropomum TaxID=42526 RepID=UPI001864E9DF|nr:zinc finger protein RFP-like [Colossoma macropomum]